MECRHEKFVVIFGNFLGHFDEAENEQMMVLAFDEILI